ncbi:hypothetical protein HMPREF3212_04539 [Citrobacter freundii]|nr:hypothetical protein HMPREF3212_04539 [Citrobacter freundii]
MDEDVPAILPLRRNRKPLQRNHEILTVFLNFCPGITPVGGNTEELIAADVPAQTNMFHITGTQHFTGFAIITGG